jgi:hypothetical protein
MGRRQPAWLVSDVCVPSLGISQIVSIRESDRGDRILPGRKYRSRLDTLGLQAVYVSTGCEVGTR